VDNFIKQMAASLKVPTLDMVDEGCKQISTNCITIDYLLNGGVPLGLITEIVGDFSTGKTLLGLYLCKKAISAGGFGIYMDSENALDKRWVENLGLKTDSIIYPMTETLEEAYNLIISICKHVPAKAKNKPIVIIWDTLAATPPATIRDDDNRSKMAAAARINSEQMPRIIGPLKQNGIALVILNQLRSKIGVTFGQKWESSGGRAIRFYSSLRLLITKFSKYKRNGSVIGMIGAMEIIKSRIGRPYTKVKFEIDFKHGMNEWSGMLSLLQKANLVKISGGRYYFRYWPKKSFRYDEFPSIYKKMWERVIDKDEEKLQSTLING